MKAVKSVRTKKTDHDEQLKSKLLAMLTSDRPYHEILEYIDNEIKESIRIVSFNYSVECYLEDGAYALSRAVESINGFTTQSSTKSVSGNKPPRMLDIRFADGTREKVPFGRIELPTFGEEAFIDMQYSPEDNRLFLTGECEKRFVRLMDEIVEETKHLVDTDSIYRSKAIKIVNDRNSPTFIDLSNIDKTDLFLTDEAAFSTQPIEARIEHTERCIRENVDLKFGVLLEGNYGLEN